MNLRNVFLVLSVVGLLAAVTASAEAAPIVYEPFDYAVGTDLSTVTPQGASWTNINPANDVIREPGKSYTDANTQDLSVAGNYMEYGSNPFMVVDMSLWPETHKTEVELEPGVTRTELGGPGSEIWMSYIRKASMIPPYNDGTNDLFWFEDIDLGGSGGEQVLLGRYYWQQTLRVNYGGGNNTAWLADQEAFCLIRHKTDEFGSTQIDMWVNPPLNDEGALETTFDPTLRSTAFFTDHSFYQLNFRNGGGHIPGFFVDYDEIRLGTSYDDVTPLASITPPTTFTSILTGSWDTVGTWDEGSTIPAVTNPVVIADGHVVTVASGDANADAESVSVEGTGQLVVESPRILGVANAVAIGPNATLSGDGQIIPTEVEVEGTIAAGASAGTLTIGAFGTGDLALTATSTLLTEVGDLVDVAGAVTIEAGATLALDDPGIIDDKLDPRIGQKTQIVLQGASVTGSFGSNVPTAGDTPGSGLYAGTPTHDGGGNLTGFAGPVVTENAADVQLTAFQALAGDSNLDSLVDVNDRIIWNSNKFTSGKTWTDADWTGEGDVDVNDRIKWNTNKFTDYTSAAAAGLAGEALAAAAGEPEFVYDALTGELSVITNGHYMTDMIVNFTGDQSAAHPALNDNNFFQNDLATNVFYDGQWFAGSWQLFDSFSNGDNGDSEPNGAATNPDGQMLLLTGLPLGLTSGDFGAASWGDFDGAAGAGEVTIVVPEPGTLLLLLAGFCGLLLWRRR